MRKFFSANRTVLLAATTTLALGAFPFAAYSEGIDSSIGKVDNLALVTSTSPSPTPSEGTSEGNVNPSEEPSAPAENSSQGGDSSEGSQPSEKTPGDEIASPAPVNEEDLGGGKRMGEDRSHSLGSLNETEGSASPAARDSRPTGLTCGVNNDNGTPDDPSDDYVDSGKVILTSTGELYRIKPGTVRSREADTLEPLPYIPTTNGSSNRMGGFGQGVNFNALGVGADGTVYVTERTSQSSPTGSKNVVVQVWKLPPGSTRWQRHGSSYNVSGVVRNLEIQGGSVNPRTGNYFFGGIENRNEGGGASSTQSAFYLFEVDARTGSVRSRGWTEVLDRGLLRPTSGKRRSQEGGDIMFTPDGDLIIGAGVHRTGSGALNAGNQNVLNVVSISAKTLEKYAGGTGSKIPNNGTISLDLTDIIRQSTWGITGFSIAPNGKLLVSSNTSERTRGVVYEVDLATSTSKLIQYLPVKPPVNVRIPPDGTGRYDEFKPGMRELWDYPKVNRRSVYPRMSRYEYSIWNGEVTDMDGCPDGFSSISLKKNVVDRKEGRDQFTLRARAASTWAGSLNASVTTSGSNSGLQDAEIGPIPVPAGQTLILSESITTSTNLQEYQPALTCTAGNGTTVNVENLTVDNKTATARVKIPDQGGSASRLSCVFENNPKPKKGTIRITKVDSSTQDRLAGATFKLYKDTNENGIVDTEDTEVPNSSHSTNNQGIVEWGEMDYGSYVAKEEVFPSGYRALGSNEHLAVVDRELTELTAFNQRIPGSVTWEKVGDTPEQEKLKGSEWTLTAPDGSVHDITDCVGNCGANPPAYTDTNPNEGSFSLANLPWGTYRLAEKKAPLGYVLSAQSTREFTVDAKAQQIDLAKIVNRKANPPALPRSGGWGSDYFLIGGAGVLGIALITGLIARRRRAE